MKNNLFLLVSILLPLISSCNIKPTIEPTEEPTVEPTTEPTEEPTVESTVEPSEEIYYLDGLASNLFVTEVPENVKFNYVEDINGYSTWVYTQKDGINYENTDCIIPNIFDDGIHGLKRVKSFGGTIQHNEDAFFKKIILSEGILHSYAYLGNVAAEELYFPSTLKTLNDIWNDPDTTKRFPYFNYNGTIEQFEEIKVVRSMYGILSDPSKIRINCLDGITYFDVYDWVD